jgi:putative ABC transport system permease protein
MEIPVAEGRNFSFEYGTDPFQTMIINRAAQRALGWEQPIGKRIVNNDDEEYDFFTIIGVIDDYHYYSLRTPIEPAVYIWRPGEMRTINLRYQADDATVLTEKIRMVYEEFFPGFYFSSRHLSQILSSQYRTEENNLNVFLWFALLCILISCLGLFGLTSFMVNQRKKEISIRKVLGGSMMQINRMLLLSFLRWVFVASIVAIPITWLIMNRWLQNYAYSISIGLPHILLTLAIITIIASSTILVISTRAAMQNPADTIKYE